MSEEWFRILWAPAVFALTIAAAVLATAYQARVDRQRKARRASVKMDPRPAYRVNVDLMHHESNYPRP